MKTTLLDKNYNIRQENNLYRDDLDHLIDQVIEAEKNGSISNKQASLLIKLIVHKEISQDLTESIKILLNSRNKSIHSFYLKLSNKEQCYV